MMNFYEALTLAAAGPGGWLLLNIPLAGLAAAAALAVLVERLIERSK